MELGGPVSWELSNRRYVFDGLGRVVTKAISEGRSPVHPELVTFYGRKMTGRTQNRGNNFEETEVEYNLGAVICCPKYVRVDVQEPTRKGKFFGAMGMPSMRKP